MAKKHDSHHTHRHPSHPEAVTRLKRAGGHLNKVTAMIEGGQPCADILQQLTAVMSALSGCRVLLLQDHLDTCLRSAIKPGHDKLIDEIGTVVKRALKGS